MVSAWRNRPAWLCAAVLAVAITFYLTANYSPDVAHFETLTDPRPTRRFRNVIVHLDLKGAPPRVEYLEQFFELLARHYVDGVLIEYEDTFPYNRHVWKVAREEHYSEEDVKRIVRAAERNGLEVIPLIQTFGHMEFLLKHTIFAHLSENLFERDSLCISQEEAISTVEEMMTQIRRLHPNSTRIHIGADEAYHIGENRWCTRRMEAENIGKTELKMRHIARMGKFAKRNLGFETVFAWNDMFDKESVETIRAAKIQDYIVPVVWGYRADVTEKGYFPDGLFDRIADVFDGFYVASAFKGADGKWQMFSNISRYLAVQKSYVKLMDLHPAASRKVQGIFVTGWSRYSHLSTLCELLPVAIPSLIVDLFYLNYQFSTSRAWMEMKNSLQCDNSKYLRGMLVESAIRRCRFPGFETFRIVMNDWRNLIDRQTRNQSVPTENEVHMVLKSLNTSLAPVLQEIDVSEVFELYNYAFQYVKDKDANKLRRLPGQFTSF